MLFGTFPVTPPGLVTYFLKLAPNSVEPAAQRSARAPASALVNDPLHRTALVFGGQTDTTGTTIGDTYVLSTAGAHAAAHRAPPRARSRTRRTTTRSATSCCSAGRSTSATAASLADTWIWNTSSWTAQIARDVAIEPLQRAAVAFDGVGVAMLGGSQTVSTWRTDDFTWNGTTWTAAPNLAEVGTVTGAATGYDPIRDELVMFGGNDMTGKPITTTWTYDGTTLTARSVRRTSGARRREHELEPGAPAADAGRWQILQTR